MKFDQFPDSTYPAYGILELLVLVTVEFVFFQVHIVDVVFLVLIMTFLEKFCLLCSLISCLNVYHSELRQNVCCS